MFLNVTGYLYDDSYDDRNSAFFFYSKSQFQLLLFFNVTLINFIKICAFFFMEYFFYPFSIYFHLFLHSNSNTIFNQYTKNKRKYNNNNKTIFNFSLSVILTLTKLKLCVWKLNYARAKKKKEKIPLLLHNAHDTSKMTFLTENNEILYNWAAYTISNDTQTHLQYFVSFTIFVSL